MSGGISRHGPVSATCSWKSDVGSVFGNVGLVRQVSYLVVFKLIIDNFHTIRSLNSVENTFELGVPLCRYRPEREENQDHVSP